MTAPTPDPDALVARARPIAFALARRFAGRRVPRDELVGEAFVAVAYALTRYDPARGVPWPRYAALCVRRRLTQFAHRWLRRSAAWCQGFDAEADDGDGRFPFDPADPRAVDPGERAAGRDVCERVRPHLAARDFDVLWARAEGRTLEEIGRRYGVTRQRVRQIERRGIERARKAVGAA